MNFDCSESYWPDAKNGAGLFYKWTVVKVGPNPKHLAPCPHPDPDPNPNQEGDTEPVVLPVEFGNASRI
jgi:hypothetical protein